MDLPILPSSVDLNDPVRHFGKRLPVIFAGRKLAIEYNREARISSDSFANDWLFEQ